MFLKASKKQKAKGRRQEAGGRRQKAEGRQQEFYNYGSEDLILLTTSRESLAVTQLCLQLQMQAGRLRSSAADVATLALPAQLPLESFVCQNVSCLISVEVVAGPAFASPLISNGLIAYR